MKKILIGMLIITGLSATSQSQIKTVTSIKDETSMTYYLVHPLHKIESTSKDVASTIRIDAANKTIQAVTASVDVTTFDSGNSNRDSHAMEVIDAISFPEALFSSTHITAKNDSVFVTGQLTFHGITREVTMNALQQWSDKKLVIHAAMWISLTGFQIERPSLLLVPVEDDLRFSLVTAYAL